jgi:hypothetical protein
MTSRYFGTSRYRSVLIVLTPYICFILHKKNVTEMTIAKMATLPAGMTHAAKGSGTDLVPN